MKTMKIFLLSLLLILVSCDKNSNDNDMEIIELDGISSDVADELDDNLDAAEEEMVEDFEEAFNIFDVTGKQKSVDRSYNDQTGYWTIIRDVDFTREVTRYRDNATVTRTDDVDIYVEIMTRFNDSNSDAIQYPRSNSDSVKTILIERSSDVNIQTDVVVTFTEGETERYRSKNRDKTANQSITMERTVDANIWDLDFSATKELDIEIITNDTNKIVNATMVVSTADLKVKKVRGLIRHRTRIISGEITRVISFDSGMTFTVISTYYDCDDPANVDDIKYTRHFYKGDANEPFRTVTVYCSNR